MAGTSSRYDAPDSPHSIGWTKPVSVRLADTAAPLVLELGGTIAPVDVEYECYGTLSPEKDNVILITHALSGDAHVAGWDAEAEEGAGRAWRTKKPGWWDAVVGPGKAIDTDRYFVLCSNVLGSCYGTTGPASISPETGNPYGLSFPLVTVSDWVEVQARLLDALGIEHLHAVIGGSLGGQQAIEWALRYPERLSKCVVLAASPTLSAQGVGFNRVGRHAVMHDPAFNGGDYYDGDGPRDGLAAARMLAHITYLSGKGMDQKFGRRLQFEDLSERSLGVEFQVESYLDYQGRSFVERFDANSYLYITRAMDYYNAAERWGDGDLVAACSRIRCDVLVASFSTDWLYTPEQCREFAVAIMSNRIPVTYVDIESEYGHDAFLVESEQVGRFVGDFLGSPSTCWASSRCCCCEGQQRSAGVAVPDRAPELRGTLEKLISQEEPDVAGVELSSLVLEDRPPVVETGAAQGAWHRWQDPVIEELIPTCSRILDLGCGNGELLSRLLGRGDVCGQGVELDQEAVMECIAQGVPVTHSDLDTGELDFPDDSFDVVVLEETLQTLHRPKLVLDEILRVGRMGIVSFPNFANWRVRRVFAKGGRMPVTPSLPNQWYDTPNIHLCSIRDFVDWTVQADVDVLDARALCGGEVRRLRPGDNFYAEEALFVIRRRDKKE